MQSDVMYTQIFSYAAGLYHYVGDILDEVIELGKELEGYVAKLKFVYASRTFLL
jgi:hypothetical protein